MITSKQVYRVLLAVILYNVMVWLLFRVESDFESANIKNLADAYWYSVVTLTTVGYGDFFPLTFWGRVIGFLFVLGSLGILGFLLTQLSLRLTAYRRNKKLGNFGTKMKNHCVVIGWDSFSKLIADQIINAGEKIAVITDQENDIDLIYDLYDKKDCFVLFSDFSNLSNFTKANIDDSKCVYINFSKDTETLVYTIGLKKKFETLNCVVAINNLELKSSFTYIGVQHVVPKNEILSKFVANYIFEPNAACFAEEIITTSISEVGFDMWEYIVHSGCSIKGKPFLTSYIEVKTKYEIILLGVNRGGELYKKPVENFVFEEGDIVVFISDAMAKQKFEAMVAS